MDKKYMSISEFSRLTGIKPANLRFYDQIGLLSPEYRGENDYRYYGSRQLDMAYIVVTLRELGIGLEEIKIFAKERTPERMISFFKQQEVRIQAEIEKLKRAREMMKIYTGMAKDAFASKDMELAVKYKEKEAIFLGKRGLPGKNKEAMTTDFYKLVMLRNMPLGYPLGAVVEQTDFLSNQFEKVSHYYLKVKHGGNAFKPEGEYATIYGHCPYGGATEIYKKLLDYIRENNLCPQGGVYEEYPFNEISEQDEQQYLVKLEVLVQ